MDWLVIARILSERRSVPTAILDSSGVIRLFNRSMERSLGWPRYEVDGRPWAEVFTPADCPQETWWIEEALRGALHNCETLATTRSGARLRLTLEFALTGRGPGQALLLTAPRITSVPGMRPPIQARDFDYDIQLQKPDFGRLQHLRVEGEQLPISAPDTWCYAALYQRPTPCPDCPLLRPPTSNSDSDGPALTVRPQRMRAPGGTSLFELVTAITINQSTARVRVRTFCEATIGAIHQAKLDQIAEQAALTTREREVLRYLVLGRSLADIATILAISERTAKYHQANVLDKVGTDSRTGLVRLFF